jgi:hypothetical protein
MNGRVLILMVLGVLLVSCETISFLTIEVKRPAEVALPRNVAKVVVVDNTAPQPDSYGHSMYSFKKKVADPSVKTAGLPDLFVDYFANKLKNRRMFRVYKQKLNPDKSFLEETALNKWQMKALADSTGADLAISLDRFLVETDIRINYSQNDYLYRVTMDGRSYPTLRIYDLKGFKQLNVLRGQDSLFWENADLSSEQVFSGFPPIPACMDDLTMYGVDRLLNRILPFDEPVQRFIYVGSNTNMRDAAVYVKKNKWNEASAIWGYLYENTKGKRLKAYCAANLALNSELSDQFEEAIRWAGLSKDLFSSISSMKDEASRVDQYISDLKVRMKQIEKLEQQIP